MKATIDMEVMNKVYNYLINRPYVEVATLVELLVSEVEKSKANDSKSIEVSNEQK